MAAHTAPFLRREGLTGDEVDGKFLRDVAEICSSSNEHEAAALALVRVYDDAYGFIDPDYVVEAGVWILEDLGFEVAWLVPTASWSPTCGTAWSPPLGSFGYLITK